MVVRMRRWARSTGMSATFWLVPSSSSRHLRSGGAISETSLGTSATRRERFHEREMELARRCSATTALSENRRSPTEAVGCCRSAADVGGDFHDAAPQGRTVDVRDRRRRAVRKPGRGNVHGHTRDGPTPPTGRAAGSWVFTLELLLYEDRGSRQLLTAFAGLYTRLCWTMEYANTNHSRWCTRRRYGADTRRPACRWGSLRI